MKILITGSNGLLGQKLVYKLRNRNDIQCIATARGANRLVEQSAYLYDEMDATNKEQVKNVLAKHLPDVVIHTAAMTNVDACELEKATCDQMNVDAVKYIVDALMELKTIVSVTN